MINYIFPTVAWPDRMQLTNTTYRSVCCARRAAASATCSRRTMATTAAALVSVSTPNRHPPGPAHALERFGVEVSGSAALLWD
eukprot:2888910-Pleurochrysis_carterae.AAC.8